MKLIDFIKLNIEVKKDFWPIRGGRVFCGTGKNLERRVQRIECSQTLVRPKKKIKKITCNVLSLSTASLKFSL